jgi:hypothetical protein
MHVNVLLKRTENLTTHEQFSRHSRSVGEPFEMLTLGVCSFRDISPAEDPAAKISNVIWFLRLNTLIVFSLRFKRVGFGLRDSFKSLSTPILCWHCILILHSYLDRLPNLFKIITDANGENKILLGFTGYLLGSRHGGPMTSIFEFRDFLGYRPFHVLGSGRSGHREVWRG